MKRNGRGRNNERIMQKSQGYSGGEVHLGDTRYIRQQRQGRYKGWAGDRDGCVWMTV